MKTKCPVHKLLTVWFYTLAIATSVAQTTHIWTGSNGTGREIGAGTNWNDGIPPLPGDTAEWDGVVPGSLNLVYNTSVLTSGPGFSGINLHLTENQTNPVSIDTDLPVSPNLAITDITIESDAGQLTLGGTNSSHRLQIVARPAGAVHHWINDSTNAVIINPQVSWAAGGGATWTMEFGGAGTWDCENYLNGEVSQRIVVNGPGTMIWNPTGYLGIVGPGTPITINGGTMILKGSHPRINSQAWVTAGTFVFDATNPPTSQQTLSGVISSTGIVQVKNGTLTLSGANTYSGGTEIDSNGTLFAGAGGTNASLGSGAITNNGLLGFNHVSNKQFTNTILGSGSLVKLGSGTLTLMAANTYSGTTTISNGTLIINGDNAATATYVYNGTLGGTGALTGTVTLNSAATLAPGAPLGFLTINNDLNIGGNVFVQVNKAVLPSNDFILATGVLTNTGVGTLAIANLGPPLSVGDQFTLFNKPLQNGAAMTVTGSGAIWKNDLAIDGSISVIGFVPRPTLIFTNLGSAIQLSWNGDFKLQSQTNSITTGLGNNWTDYPGGSVSPANISISPASGAVFFRLISTP